MNAFLAAIVGLGLLVGAVASESMAPWEAQSAVRLYVPNQMGASVSVLDGDGRVLQNVDLRALGFSEHAMPHQVVADGSAWYVTLAGDGWVLKFDTDNHLVAKTRVDEPGMVVLDAGRDRLYVSRALGAVNPARSLAVLRASDLQLLDEPDIFIPRPHALAVDTVTGRVYSGSLGTNQIAAYDPGTERASITTFEGPPQSFVGLATSPDGRQLVATTQITDRLLAFDATDPVRLTPLASVAVGALPYDVAYSPDGRAVWFPNQRAGTVTRVDTRSWTVTAVVRHAAFQEPHGVAVSADGRTVYVSSHGRTMMEPAHPAAAGHDMATSRANGTLAVLDAVSAEVRSVTEVGPYAAALGLAEPAVVTPQR
jgi:DNA-binding beta-propeller fold protein YncE